MAKLNELPFVDLYLCLSGQQRSHYKPRRSEFGVDQNYVLGAEYDEDLEALTEKLRPLLELSDEPSVQFEGMRLRASGVTTSHGHEWVALRRNPAQPPALDTLGLDPRMIEQLRYLGKRDGLVLIAGATGQGKTTLACSLLQYYLQQYGDVAFTIEDPAEFSLEGRYQGSGYAYQVEVHDDADWARMLKRSLRWQPRYIFVGEVRTPDAAAQLLRAATSGHLVITTIHGGSVEEALEGLLQLAQPAVGSRAANLLAAGLTAVWHQQIMPDHLKVRMYITEENNLGDPVRSNIRAAQIGQIATYVDKQMARIATMPLPQGNNGGNSGTPAPIKRR